MSNHYYIRVVLSSNRKRLRIFDPPISQLTIYNYLSLRAKFGAEDHNYKYMVWWATGTCNAQLLRWVVAVHLELFYVDSPSNLTVTLDNPFQRIFECPELLAAIMDLFFSNLKAPSLILNSDFMRVVRSVYKKHHPPGKWYKESI
jgi:hypothetical protein